MAVADDEEAEKRVLEAEVEAEAGEELLQVWESCPSHAECTCVHILPFIFLIGSYFSSPKNVAQGLRKGGRLFRVEVKALQMRPAHPKPLMEQASLPMIRGKALPQHWTEKLCHIEPCKAVRQLKVLLVAGLQMVARCDNALYVCREYTRPSFQRTIQDWQAKHDDAALLAVADRLVAEHHELSATAEDTHSDKQVSAPRVALPERSVSMHPCPF